TVSASTRQLPLSGATAGGSSAATPAPRGRSAWDCGDATHGPKRARGSARRDGWRGMLVLDPAQRLLACHRNVTTKPSNAANDPVSVLAHGLEGTGQTMNAQPIDSSATEARLEARWPILTAIIVIMTLTAL